MSQQLAKKITSSVTTGGTGVQGAVLRSSGVAYYADTDGFVTAMGGPGGKAIYHDASATPTTVVANCSANAGGGGDYGCIAAPIKKGNYWQVSSASYVYWGAIT